MNKNTFHFRHLRLNDSPQTKVESQSNTPGFSSYKECDDFCKRIGSGHTIIYYDRNGNGLPIRNDFGIVKTNLDLCFNIRTKLMDLTIENGFDMKRCDLTNVDVTTNNNTLFVKFKIVHVSEPTSENVPYCIVTFINDSNNDNNK